MESNMEISLRQHSENDENRPADANFQLDNLRRALQGLKDSTYQRVSKVGDLAKEQAAGAGQSDLRRLKRQFSSLKNTFMLYHTKEHFIDGLLDDLPDGSEERKLQGLEEQVQNQGAKVKAFKQHNVKIQEDVAELITQIADIMRELEGVQSAALAQLEQAEADAGRIAAAESMAPIEEGPDEAECEAELASENALARQTEAAIAAQEAEISELKAAIKSEEQALQTLRQQMRTSAQQQKEQQQGGETAPKQPFADAMAWCTEVTALMATLGGVRILCIEEDELTIGLTTHADLGAGAGEAPVARWEHELTLAMNPGKADLAHADLQPAHVALAHADLQPAHVDISDIAAAAEGGARSISFVMREVHARLSERLCRAMHIQEAGKEFPLQPHAPDATLLHATLPGSEAEAELLVPLNWPTAPLSIKGLQSTRDNVDLGAVLQNPSADIQLAASSLIDILRAAKSAVDAHVAQMSA